MATALVMSGGAAQGSFEVGALQFLYMRRFFADIICSTSVGSVNAVQLAHGGTEATQAAAFNTLRTIWQTELIDNGDMVDEAPWLATVSPKTRTAIARLLAGSIDVPTLSVAMMVFPLQTAIALIAGAIQVGADLVDAIDKFGNAQSFLTLGPTRTKIAAHLNQDTVEHSGVELRLVAVSLDSGAIRYVTQDGGVIERDGTPVAGPNPRVCRKERLALEQAKAVAKGASDALQAARAEGNVTDEQQEWEAASKAKDAADTALKTCMANAMAAGTATELKVPLIDGAIASSSIPVVFPPTMLGDEAYVDGGIRWTLPLLTAVDLDPDLIVAINTGPAGIPKATTPFRDANVFDIGLRAALGLELWETQERHLQVAQLIAEDRLQKVWVITPRVEVHDGFTVDPGLIDINIAYGYMCAADVTTEFPFPRLSEAGGSRIGVLAGDHGPLHPADAPPARDKALFVDAPTDEVQRKLADAIAQCRKECWQLEHEVYGQRIPDGPLAPSIEHVAVPDPNALDRLRTLKTILGLLVESRREHGGNLPPAASAWADSWELHRWMPGDVPGPANTPWGNFSSAAGSRNPATRPNALLATPPSMSATFLLNPNRHEIKVTPLSAFGGPGAVTVVPDEYLDALPVGAPL